MWRLVLPTVCLLALSGCALSLVDEHPEATSLLADASSRRSNVPTPAPVSQDAAPQLNLDLSAPQSDLGLSAPQSTAESQPADAERGTVPESVAVPEGQPDRVALDDVLQSVRRSFPLLQAAAYSRDIAAGRVLSAQGAYDMKLKAATENGPVGFYETYRHSVGVEQPTYSGGSLFGGYRLGRGSFQPWYLERLTDDGGELHAGFSVPLLRNVSIDARRAELWRSELGQGLAEQDIRLQRIEFLREAAYAYWNWVAAGRRQQIAAALLQLADDRNEGIRRRVETGDADPPVLQDNRRLIVSRQAKLIETERKLQQAAIKLSLFYRDEQGQPLIPDVAQLPAFPVAQALANSGLDASLDAAGLQRPELQAIRLLREQLEIDASEARNQLLPDVRAVVSGSQDVGQAATSKNDKSQLELEAGLLVDVPVQRRSARGKLTSVEGKLGQLTAKRQMVEDKIGSEVRSAHAALLAALQQTEQARESVQLAVQLAEIELRKFELGESDLLSVNLREQQAAEAQNMEVDALLEYFLARADFRAALGLD